MKSSVELVKLLVDFSQMDLDSLRQGDWLNLRDDLYVFLGWKFSGEGFELLSSPFPGMNSFAVDRTPDSLSEEEIRKMQIDLKELLFRAVELSIPFARLSRGEDPQYLPTFYKPIEIEHPLKIIITFLDRKFGMQAAYNGHPRDMFFLQLAHVFNLGGFKKVCKCPACGKLFLRVRKQQYCSYKCSDRVYMQKYRVTHPTNKEQESERKHKKYVEEMKRRTGAKNPRVARRKRVSAN